MAPASSTEFLDIQATVECGFTFKLVRDMIKTYNQSVKELLKKHKTSLVIVPPEFTSRVQVVDVLINKPFKDEVRSLFEDNLDKYLNQYVDDKINAI